MKEEMESEAKQHLLICQCHNIEHQVIFSYFPEEGDVYMTIHLRPLSFWKRLKNGIKYIFGYRSIYGDFDEFIFKPEDYSKVQDVADHLKKHLTEEKIKK